MAIEKDWSGFMSHVNGCPFYRLLGFEAVEVKEGFARLRMPAAEKLFQFQNAVHGGAIYSIADAAIAVALLTVSEPGEKALTIEGKVNFIAAVTEGYVEATGRIVHKGRSIALGDAEVFRADGRLVAKGLITYTLRK